MGFGKRLLFLSFLDLLEACLGHVSTAIPPLLHTVIQLIRTAMTAKRCRLASLEFSTFLPFLSQLIY